jgi:hypothetical protein
VSKRFTVSEFTNQRAQSVKEYKLLLKLIALWLLPYSTLHLEFGVLVSTLFSVHEMTYRSSKLASPDTSGHAVY